MEIKLEINQSLTQEMTVAEKHTARALGSGRIDVFATPAMIAFMENTAMKLAEEGIDADFGTVGINISTTHSKATPVGMKVSCTATITEINGRKLGLKIVATDEQGEIGSCTHDRFVINTEKFMSKLNS